MQDDFGFMNQSTVEKNRTTNESKELTMNTLTQTLTPDVKLEESPDHLYKWHFNNIGTNLL